MLNHKVITQVISGHYTFIELTHLTSENNLYFELCRFSQFQWRPLTITTAMKWGR